MPSTMTQTKVDLTSLTIRERLKDCQNFSTTLLSAGIPVFEVGEDFDADCGWFSFFKVASTEWSRARELRDTIGY